MDAGDVTEHVDPDAEAVQGRLQPRVDFLRGQGVRRIDMRQSRDGDILEKHGNPRPMGERVIDSNG